MNDRKGILQRTLVAAALTLLPGRWLYDAYVVMIAITIFAITTIILFFGAKENRWREGIVNHAIE